MGCLLEKQRITPETYPLSVSRIRRASNQAHNREPRTSYEEPEISDALRRLIARGWVELSIDPGIRVRRYRHLLDETLGLDSAELALMAVLFLRGPQTAGKLKQRTDRLYGFEDVAGVYEALDRLVERGYVLCWRRGGSLKEERYEQRLCVAPESEETEIEDGDTDTVVADEVQGAVNQDGEEKAAEDTAVGPGGAVTEARAAAVESTEAGAAAGQSGQPAAAPATEPPSPTPYVSPASPEAWMTPRKADTPDARLDWLENEVVKLRAQVSALLEALEE